MPKLIVVTRVGDEVVIESAQRGASVMELMRDNSVPDLLVLCGGSRSCATCRVSVDPAFMDKLPEAVDEENELLTAPCIANPHRACRARSNGPTISTDCVSPLAPED